MRKAFCIELYDAGLLINPYGDDAAARYGKHKQYIIPGNIIERLAKYFGVDYNEFIIGPAKGVEQKRYKEYLEDQDFKIEQRLTEYNISNFNECFAEIVSPNILNIKLTFSNQGISDQDEPDQIVECTYCGSFFVQWYIDD